MNSERPRVPDIESEEAMHPGDEAWELVQIVRTGFAEGATHQERAAGEVAFRQIFDAHYDRVFRRVLGVTHDPWHSQDIVMEAFGRVYDKLHTYRPNKAKIGSWISRIAFNLAIDRTARNPRWRKETAVDVEEGVFESRLGTVEPGEQGEQGAIINLKNEALRFALGALNNERQRRAIELHYLRGVPVREVAEHLEIPLGTAKSAIFYGLRKLRVDLLNGMADPEQ